MKIRFILSVLLFGTTFAAHAQFKDAVRRAAVDAEGIVQGSVPPAMQKKLDRNFQVLAIGEQTHGTSEFFQARGSLIRALANDGTINAVGLEAPVAEVELLNQYILTGKGNLREILTSFRSYMYECREFVELVESVRRLKSPVRFFGVDMQSPFQALQDVADGCPTLADSAGKLIADYRQLSNEIYSHSITSGDFADLMRTSNYLFRRLESPELAACAKKPGVRKGVKAYRQFLMLNDSKYKTELAALAPIRDSLMAENLLDEASPGQKIVLLAHNGHVQKTRNIYSRSMGEILKSRLGEKYQCMGLVTSAGTYTAFNSGAGRVTRDNPLPDEEANSFEAVFASLEKPAFFLRSTDIQASGLPTRYKLLPYGHTDTPFITSDLLRDFDYVLYLKQTSGNDSFYLKK